MQHRTLGRTELSCSVVGLGTWALAAQIYGDVPEADAHRTVHAALDAGINVFDTAPLYGDGERNGIAEERLGAALGHRRNDVLVFSKFGRYSTDGAAPNFHAARARESVEGSLKRLGRDTLDVVFFHSPFGPSDIHDDVWAELGRLKAEGKIRFVGHSISKFADTEPMARGWAEERRIDVVQVVYSLMNREAAALIHDLAAQGVGIVAREVLANGFLSGAINADTVFPPGSLNARYDRAEVADRAAYADALARVLVRDDVPNLPAASFRWVLDDPAVALALSGAKTPAELADAVAAAHAQPYTAAEHDEAVRMHTRDFDAA